MVRINLLPAEVIERRKYERFYPYVFIAGAILLGIVAVIWAGTQFMISERSDSLQQVEESEAALNRQAESLAIFEQQQQELDQRQRVAATALGGRVNMGKIMEEISLVLPDEVWVEGLFLSEDDGMDMDARTHDKPQPEMAEGYKSVAATLVRLGSLPSLADVWLANAESETEFGDFQGEDSGGSALALQFQCSASIVVSPAVPAPPTTAGQ